MKFHSLGVVVSMQKILYVIIITIGYILVLSFFLTLYTARPSFEYYRQLYFVHSGLQDESLQVTISKSP